MSIISVRVYGILINELDQVLVSDEYIRGNYFTKFPGGGLEFGEGLREGLKREFQEELQLAVEIKDHIYTTDFFQRSAFNHNHQILSVYYHVEAMEPIRVPLRTNAFEFDAEQLAIYEKTQQTESFRFMNWNDFSSDALSLPIDKIVADLLKSRR